MNTAPRVRPSQTSVTSGLGSPASSSVGTGTLGAEVAPVAGSDYGWPHEGYRTIAALFDSRDGAQNAIADLKSAGTYLPSEIGVAMRDRDQQGELVKETGTHAAEGAVSGAVSGGVLGGVAGWLVAIGALAIPGVGPMVAGGALASALGVTGATAVAGAGIGAAAGGLVGALIGLGIPEADAEYFEQGFREGGVVVTVRARDTARAAEILRQHGGSVRPASTTDTTTISRPV